MSSTTNFTEWLESYLVPTDYEEVYNLSQAVENAETWGVFEGSENNGMTFVKRYGCEEYLSLVSDKAKKTFLEYIENTYCKDLDIEGYYAFHRAMEKDD